MQLPSTLSRLVRLATATLCAVPLISAVAVATAPVAGASVPSLHAPSFGPAIEPPAPYVAQVSCRPGFRAGSAALAQLLVRTYPNTSAGGPRGCLAGSPSEHYDGRAVDWMNSVKNPVQAMQAASVIKFLLATDSYGNTYAMARRMGIMYMIWDNHIWGMWSGKWEDYNGCTKTPSPALDTACHRDHIHFSMSWDGALGYTSFWSRRVVSTPDYGPCRPRDLNWSGFYAVFRTTPCPHYAPVGAPAGSSALMIALVRYSGVELIPGMTGEAVKVVQQAFHTPVTGRYDAATVAAVNRVKKAHRLPVNSVVDPTMWRLLLAAYRPRS